MVEKPLELLAPAGDLESFFAAINNGADAVYFGLADFNARIKAENFDKDKLKQAIRFAHFHNVKVYVALNTLVKNSEIKNFLKAVEEAVLLKADAFIVQDLGVVYLLKKYFPNIILHASTQMGIHNLEGAKIAESMGIKRVVLSRETKLSDIKSISENTGLELEFFVQGALCVAFSGNCYLSSAMLDKSGNRGVCAQLCRHLYSYQGKEGYFLSARDLCLLSSIKDLIDAGITSFKIEGRLRRSGYVAEAVSVYREVLDNINRNIDTEKLEFRLKKVFNRGQFLKRAYLDLKASDNVIHTKAQNHQGVEIGKVIKIEPFKNIYRITVSTSHFLNKGDGIKFFNNGKEALSLGVGNVEKIGKNLYSLYSKFRPEEGMSVNIILDSQTEKASLNAVKKEKLTVSVFAEINRPLELLGICNGIETSVISEYICPKAENLGTQTEEIVSQLMKAGESGFKISVDILKSKIENIFIPKSILNGLRRRLLEEAEEAVVKNFENNNNTEISEIDINCLNTNRNLEKESCNIIFGENSFKNEDMQNSIFAVCPKIYNIEKVRESIKRIKAKNNIARIALDLPIISNGKDMEILNGIVEELKDELNYLIVNNLYGYSFKEKLPLIAGYGMNIFNDYAVKTNVDLGAEIIINSVELKEVLISVKPLGIMKNFQLPLMTFAHCVNKTLTQCSCDRCNENALKSFVFYKDREPFRAESYKIFNCYYKLYKN